MTPDERLIEAAQKGNISDLIDLLPRANARCDESSPLRGAAMYGHATCVELLLPHSLEFPPNLITPVPYRCDQVVLVR